MKRKQINRIIQMPITIHAEADVQKAVTQIHLAAGKASKGGRIEITILDSSGEPPKGQTEDLSKNPLHLEVLKDLDQARSRITELETLAKQQPEASGAPTVNPGSENKPSDQSPGTEIPELVKKAQAKIASGKIPTSKERKALEEWEKSNPDT